MRLILLIPALVLLLLLAAGTAALMSGEVHEAVRVRLVAQVEALLGREVAVGALRGDPIRGVVLERVAVASRTRLAQGVLFRVDRAVVLFDVARLVVDLALGQGPLRAVTHVRLEGPDVWLERDVRGRWNILDLFPARPPAVPPGPPPFRGRVAVARGTVHLLDRAAPRAAFQARFEEVAGVADLHQAPVVAVEGSLTSVFRGRRSPARARGRFTVGQGTFDLDLQVTDAPVAQWGPYLIRSPRAALQDGAFDGRFHLLASRWGERLVLDYRGTLALRDGAGQILPQRVPVRHVTGTVTVNNLHLESDGIRLVLGTSPLEVSGEVSLVGGGRLDLVVRSPGLDLTTLRRLLFPSSALRLTGSAGGAVRIEGPMRAPVVVGRVADAHGVIARQPFTHAAADFTLYGDLVALEDFSLTAGRGRLAGDARITLGRPGLLLAATAEGVSLDLPARAGVGLLLPLRGTASGRFVVARFDDRAAAEGVGTVGRGSGLGVGFDRLEAAFAYGGDGVLTLPYLRARRGPAEVHTSGEVGPRGTLDLDLSAQQIPLTLLAAETGVRLPLAGRLSGEGQVGGTLADPLLLATVWTDGGRVGRLRFDSLDGVVRLTRHTLRTPQTVVRQGGGRYVVSGSVGWAAGGRFDLTAEVRDIPADTLAEAVDLPVEAHGRITGTVTLRGTPGRPRAQGRLTLQDGRIAGQPVTSAEAAFRWTPELLTVEQAEARLGTSLVTARGTVPRRGPLALRFTARGFDLRDLSLLPREALQVAGTVDLDGRVGGSAAAPTVTATLASTDLLVNGVAFDAATGHVAWRNGRLALDPLAFTRAGGQYVVSGTVQTHPPYMLDLQARVEGGRLATLLDLGRLQPPLAVDGRLQGTVAVRGPVGRPQAALNATLTEGRLGDHPMPEARLDLAMADDVVHIREVRARVGEGLVAAAGRVDLQGHSQVEVGGQELPFDLLRPVLGTAQPLAGRFDFATQVSGRLAEPEVGISLEVRDGRVGAVAFDALVANAFYKDGQFHVEQALLREDGHRIKGEGRLPFNPALRRLADRPMRFQITLEETTLGVLTLLTPAVREATGRLEGGMLIEGTPTHPELAGRLAVRDGRLRLRGLEVPLEALVGEITFTDDRVRVQRLTARLGRGTVGLAGAVVVREFRPVRAEGLALQARGARLAAPPYVNADVDADLTLTGPLGDPDRPPELAGGVTLRNGTVAPPVGRAAAPSRPGPPTVRFREVHLASGPDLAVQLGRLRIDLRQGSALVLGGTLAEPSLQGELVAERGALNVLGRTVLLQEGAARFVPGQGLVPRISARAETRVGSTRIFIEVTDATPAELGERLVLTSDPPMSRQEIAALLYRESGLAALREGDVGEALRLELGRLLLGQVGASIARVLGLEEFTITYDFERPLQLRVGRLLLRDLYLTLTTVFEERTRFIWALEYRFAPAMLLTLNLDTFGRTDVLLLYRITF
jgi:translocation and assembly module TamB